MARAIDAEGLIRVVSEKKMTEVFPNWKELSSETRNAIGVFGQYWKALIEDAPTIEPKQEWISVKDRLPEIGQKVLVFDVDAELDISKDIHIFSFECDEDGYYWSDEGGWWNDFENVSHWMPLPEPPEMNNEEEQA